MPGLRRTSSAVGQFSGRVRVFAAAACLVAAGCASQSGDSAPAEASEAAREPIALEVPAAELAQVKGISEGSDSAPVEIHEFADFQCPGCAQFALAATPYIRERYVDSGVVRYTYFDYPLVSIHPNAFLAARAARCADEQEQFWPYHDMLYTQQSVWSGEADPAGSFTSFASQLGLDQDRFSACLNSDRYAAEITRSMKLGEYLRVPGTPTIFINGEKVEVQSVQQLDQLIQRAAGGAVPPA